LRIKTDLPSVLKYHSVIIESAAREAGLDFFEVVFELLDAKDVNAIAAYGGFPVRYPSWRHGMEYERLEKSYRWGFSKIYELVINNDPTYAYLVKSNSLLEQKLVMAHVYGHADFFKHNIWFAPTERRMLDRMGVHATRIRRYIDAFGQEKVESFVDLALSVDTLIDPFLPLRQHRSVPPPANLPAPLSERTRMSLEALSQAPLSGPEPQVQTWPAHERRGVRQKALRLPTYDILGFLVERAPTEPWQRDILRIVRREAYYFVPQRMTKIMNEGWASYWHSSLLTGGLLEPSEIVDFADCHSNATACAPGQLNPYKLGIELFRHAAAQGLDVFQLRKVHKDLSFVHKLVDEEFSYRHLRPDIPPGPGAEQPWNWHDAKSQLMSSLAWGGLPQIELVEEDADGELVLVHHHDGRDLKLDQAQETLRNLAGLWGRPVNLLTILDKQGRKIVCDGDQVTVLDTTEADRACRGLDADPGPGPDAIAS